jgi:uncharacterized protein
MKKLLAAAAILAALYLPAKADPSFNCNYAKAPDEVAICQNPDLSAADSQMSGWFFVMRNNLHGPAQAAFVQAQRNWLRKRHACGYDAECIGRLYDEHPGVNQ